MNDELQKLRKKINKIDKEILKKIAERFEIVELLAAFKKEKSLRVADLCRETDLYDFYKKQSSELGLDESFVKRVFELIISQSKELQKKQN